MVFFTTPELLEIGGLPLVSPFEKPTRIEALRYYRRVVDTYELAIEFGEQVIAVERESGASRDDIFAIETRSDKGVRRIRHSRNRDLRDRLFRSSELHRRARRESAARVALLQRVARLLPEERRHRRRRKLGGRDGARAVPLGRDRDARASPSAAEAEHQILGAGPTSRIASRKDRSEGCSTRRSWKYSRRRSSSSATAPRKRFRPMRCSC